MQRGLLRIKQALVAAPILCCPDYSLPFVINTYASGFGMGAVFSQPHPDGDRVICYLSRSLTRLERNFSTTERECLAVVWAIEKLRPYIEGLHFTFTVVTDHYSLKWLQNLKNPTERLARWAVRLVQYSFTVEHRKGKDNVIPDLLSRSVTVLDAVGDSCNVVPAPLSDRWYKKMAERIESFPIQYSNWRLSDGKFYKYVKQSHRLDPT